MSIAHVHGNIHQQPSYGDNEALAEGPTMRQALSAFLASQFAQIPGSRDVLLDGAQRFKRSRIPSPASSVSRAQSWTDQDQVARSGQGLFRAGMAAPTKGTPETNSGTYSPRRDGNAAGE